MQSQINITHFYKKLEETNSSLLDVHLKNYIYKESIYKTLEKTIELFNLPQRILKCTHFTFHKAEVKKDLRQASIFMLVTKGKNLIKYYNKLNI